MILRAGPHRLELGAPAAADGHPQRDAGLVLRRARGGAARGARGARRARCSRRARTSSTSAGSPRAATGPRSASRRRSSASCGLIARARRRTAPDLGRHLQAGGRRGGDRGGRGDRQRRLAGCATRRLADVCAATGAGAGAHAHGGGAEGHAAGSGAPTRTSWTTCVAFLRERMEVGVRARAWTGAARARPGAGLRQDAGADGRGAARGWTRLRALGRPDPARRLAQGLRRRDHRARARASASAGTLAALG